jgi:hypothetical protein
VSTIAPSGMRYPRCQSRTTVQNAIELRPGVEYLTLRCISCGLIYNAQVPSNQNGLHDIGPQNESVPLGQRRLLVATEARGDNLPAGW